MLITAQYGTKKAYVPRTAMVISILVLLIPPAVTQKKAPIITAAAD